VLVLCKRCGEPWELDLENKESILDYFSDDDYIQLRLDKKIITEYSGLTPQIMSYIVGQIGFGSGCFSCGFDPMYQKTYAGALYKGAYVVNFGKIETITGDAPDPSVGLFGGWVEVTFDRDNTPVPIEHVITFDWNQEILIRSKV